jgi:hypothetical protein
MPYQAVTPKLPTVVNVMCALKKKFQLKNVHTKNFSVS